MDSWWDAQTHRTGSLPPSPGAKPRVSPGALDAASLRALFDAEREQLLGIEEEVMALDPETLDLAPRAPALLEHVGGDPAFKLELPASQIELVTQPRARVDECLHELHDARRRLADALHGEAALLGAGVHPFASPAGILNAGEHYERVAAQHGGVAALQLVCGLHVHVTVGGAERALAVYNAIREYLPLLAALAANAPLYAGRDSGMASVRPLISGLLPRQGVPPRFASWEELAADLEWASGTGRVERMRGWWWQLRLHAELGTLEIRVPDTQSLAAESGALAAVAATLALWLAARHDGDDLAPPARDWRIAENGWSAARHGVDGQMSDLRSGARRNTAELLDELLGELEGHGGAIAAAEQLVLARAMLAAGGGARRQRELLHALGDPLAVTAELSRRFAEEAGAGAGGR